MLGPGNPQEASANNPRDMEHCIATDTRAVFGMVQLPGIGPEGVVELHYGIQRNRATVTDIRSALEEAG
jgi:hypothetical protein